MHAGPAPSPRSRNAPRWHRRLAPVPIALAGLLVVAVLWAGDGVYRTRSLTEAWHARFAHAADLAAALRDLPEPRFAILVLGPARPHPCLEATIADGVLSVAGGGHGMRRSQTGELAPILARGLASGRCHRLEVRLYGARMPYAGSFAAEFAGPEGPPVTGPVRYLGAP